MMNRPFVDLLLLSVLEARPERVEQRVQPYVVRDKAVHKFEEAIQPERYLPGRALGWVVNKDR